MPITVCSRKAGQCFPLLLNSNAAAALVEAKYVHASGMSPRPSENQEVVTVECEVEEKFSNLATVVRI